MRPMSQRFSTDVLIIGGGAAGLAAALPLASFISALLSHRELILRHLHMYIYIYSSVYLSIYIDTVIWI